MAQRTPDTPRVTVEGDASTTEPARATLGPGTDWTNIFKYVDGTVGGVKAELMGEIRALAAAMREGETRRSADVDRLTRELSQVPTLEALSKANKRAVLTFAGIVIAALALLWTVFGVGASITGGIADRVIESREGQGRIEKKLDRLLKEQPNGQQQRQQPQQQLQPPVRPPLEGNVTGNQS